MPIGVPAPAQQPAQELNIPALGRVVQRTAGIARVGGSDSRAAARRCRGSQDRPRWVQHAHQADPDESDVPSLKKYSIVPPPECQGAKWPAHPSHACVWLGTGNLHPEPVVRRHGQRQY